MNALPTITLIVIAAAVCLSAAPGAAAQTDDQPSDAGSAQGRWYRLTRDAEFSRGCYDPCDCPLFLAGDFRGVFRLAPSPNDFAGPPTFAVEDVRLRADFGNQRFLLAGRGVYRLGATDAGRVNAMVLYLSINGDAAATFQSGLVPAGAEFPLIDVTVSMNGMECFDTVMRLSARPVRRLSDVNSDDAVDARDVGAVLAAWGTDHADCDVNADGVVNATDLAQTLTEWGE